MHDAVRALDQHVVPRIGAVLVQGGMKVVSGIASDWYFLFLVLQMVHVYKDVGEILTTSCFFQRITVYRCKSAYIWREHGEIWGRNKVLW